jgi:hypothetical protein
VNLKHGLIVRKIEEEVNTNTKTLMEKQFAKKFHNQGKHIMCTFKHPKVSRHITIGSFEAFKILS